MDSNTLIGVVQLVITVVGLGFLGYQTYIQNTRLKAQSGIIEDMKAWKEMIDIETMKKWTDLKVETITMQTEKEKKEIEEKLKKSFEVSESEHKNVVKKATEEVHKREQDLMSTEQRLAETKLALDDCKFDLLTQQAKIQFHLDINTELLNLAVNLTATHIPQERWDTVADKYTKEANSVFKEILNKRGVEIVNEIKKETEKAISGLTAAEIISLNFQRNPNFKILQQVANAQKFLSPALIEVMKQAEILKKVTPPISDINQGKTTK